MLHEGRKTNSNCLNAAYWIAFGPHGPRAEPPAGEGQKVALYTFIGVGVSLVVFIAMRMAAKPAPATMNKEWQEASNEYLIVRSHLHAARLRYVVFSASFYTSLLTRNPHRHKKPTPSPVSPRRVTLARARSSLPPRPRLYRISFVDREDEPLRPLPSVYHEPRGGLKTVSLGVWRCLSLEDVDIVSTTAMRYRSLILSRPCPAMRF
jgi:hypothetical protein